MSRPSRIALVGLLLLAGMGAVISHTTIQRTDEIRGPWWIDVTATTSGWVTVTSEGPQVFVRDVDGMPTYSASIEGTPIYPRIAAMGDTPGVVVVRGEDNIAFFLTPTIKRELGPAHGQNPVIIESRDGKWRVAVQRSPYEYETLTFDSSGTVEGQVRSSFGIPDGTSQGFLDFSTSGTPIPTDPNRNRLIQGRRMLLANVEDSFTAGQWVDDTVGLCWSGGCATILSRIGFEVRTAEYKGTWLIATRSTDGGHLIRLVPPYPANDPSAGVPTIPLTPIPDPPASPPTQISDGEIITLTREAKTEVEALGFVFKSRPEAEANFTEADRKLAFLVTMRVAWKLRERGVGLEAYSGASGTPSPFAEDGNGTYSFDIILLTDTAGPSVDILGGGVEPQALRDTDPAHIDAWRRDYRIPLNPYRGGTPPPPPDGGGNNGGGQNEPQLQRIETLVLELLEGQSTDRATIVNTQSRLEGLLSVLADLELRLRDTNERLERACAARDITVGIRILGTARGQLSECK